ncbi:MAG: glutamine amidotransferase-related protein [Ostreibacterium sp.]
MMQIGILRCDNVRSTLSAEFGEYPEMIKDSFLAVDTNFEFSIYHANEGLLPDCVDKCDAYLITGSRHSVFDNDELWINQLRDFIVKLNKAKVKAIGFCFGHQLIAEAMGGKIERADCGWQIGVHTGVIQSQQDYMCPRLKQLHIAMMCEDQIQSVPDNAVVLASSPNCDYLMLQYGEHFLSTQGHPEFSQAFAKALINVRYDEFPSKRVEKGLASFSDNALDNHTLFQWFTNFLQREPTHTCADKTLS